jgi:hypothetical protein
MGRGKVVENRYRNKIRFRAMGNQQARAILDELPEFDTFPPDLFKVVGAKFHGSELRNVSDAARLICRQRVFGFDL